jgi:hypothetical protein
MEANSLGMIEFFPSKNLVHCSSAILSANKFIRKLNGGSQSILVQANDSKYYVVKMMENPQGSNVLANESLGATVARAVGLPVAHNKGIYLSDTFIDNFRDLWFESPAGRRRPNRGVHFGSLFIGQPSGAQRPNEYISPSRLDNIANRQDFLGMYILDVWANHQDSRQAVFCRSSDGTQKAFFIDHGHMFGGPEWTFEDRPGIALHLEKKIYTDLWNEDLVASWISHLQMATPSALSYANQAMQPEWYQGRVEELIGRLTERLCRLPEIVRADIDGCWHLIKPRTINDKLRLPDSGIQDLRTSDGGSTNLCHPSVA